MKPVDIVITSLIWSNEDVLYYEEMATLLGISASHANGAAKRAQKAGLLNRNLQPINPALQEVLIHAVKYYYPAKPGTDMRGIVTGSHAILPDIEKVGKPWVWADANGNVRGPSIEPIHHSIPFYAPKNDKFHKLFAAIDLIRCGNAREYKLGQETITSLLS